jgi:hypothetical protein
MDFKISDLAVLLVTINVENKDYAIRNRSFKNIGGYIFEVSGITGDTANLNIYHSPSVNLVDYNPNIILTVTKKLEFYEGDIFEIPFTIANIGKVGAKNITINLENSGEDIIEGTWKGTLNPEETKDLKFKARFNSEGEYELVFNVNTAQYSEKFQEKVNIKSKVTSILKKGTMNSLIYITRGYILTQDRIRMVQDSINIFFLIGILLSSGIILNSARQNLPTVEKSKDSPKKKSINRKDQSIKSKKDEVTISQERLKVSKQRRAQGLKRESIKKREK